VNLSKQGAERYVTGKSNMKSMTSNVTDSTGEALQKRIEADQGGRHDPALCFATHSEHQVRVVKDKTATRSVAATVRCFAVWVKNSVILMVMSVLCRNVLPVRAQESSELAKQAQNPIANLISIPFENDFNPEIGIHKEDSYVLQMKPVVPFRLSSDWIVITRTIIPVIQLPAPAPGMDGASGLGDIQESLFLSPAKVGPIIWGAGPVISFPTATQHLLGTGKWSVGPTAVGLTIQGHWLFGALAQNLFSVAGPSGRPDVDQMLIQPFVNYNLPHGWYLTSSPIITANWETSSRERWTVPVGGGVGKIIRIGKLPVNASLQYFQNVEHPDGTTPWSLRFEIQFLFPRK
jgi:hypothetical protein